MEELVKDLILLRAKLIEAAGKTWRLGASKASISDACCELISAFLVKYGMSPEELQVTVAGGPNNVHIAPHGVLSDQVWWEVLNASIPKAARVFKKCRGEK